MTRTILKRCDRCHGARISGVLDVCARCGRIRSGDLVGRTTRGQPSRFLYRLAVAAGQTVTRAQMIEWLWADRKDGGPTDVAGVLKQAALDGRRALARAGIPVRVTTVYQFGWRLEANP